MEVIVVVVIISVLVGILVPVISGARRSAKSVSCLSQLRQIGAAMQQYATDNTGVFPDTTASGVSWETLVAKYTGSGKIFRCPADEEVFVAVRSSYDWRDTGHPISTLAGRSANGVKSDAVLAFDALPNWHKQNMMNVVRVDGSTATMDSQKCLINLMKPVRD